MLKLLTNHDLLQKYNKYLLRITMIALLISYQLFPLLITPRTYALTE